MNFAIRDPTFLKEDIDIEAGIKYTSQEEKAGIQEEIRQLLTPTKRMEIRERASSNHHKTIKGLKEKPVFYLPTEKGNVVVIMDKGAYDDLVRKKLEEGKFHIVKKDLLPDSVKRVERALAECKLIIKKAAELRIPNPSLSRIQYLPKIHKEGNEVSEIIAATNSSIHFAIAKWLSVEVR